MTMRTRFLLAFAAAAMFASLPFVGCSSKPTNSATAEHDAHSGDEHTAMGHTAEEHAEMEHHDEDHEHEHGAEALTEQDVTLPTSFAAGVAQLTELHEKIEHLIEHNELADVHRVAEEMAIVARKMKELAAHDIAEDKRAEAGRLCNEVAGYFHPIDEAADAGKKDETMAIHMQMVDTIGKLEALSK